jgi:hypothetical protein
MIANGRRELLLSAGLLVLCRDAVYSQTSNVEIEPIRNSEVNVSLFGVGDSGSDIKRKIEDANAITIHINRVFPSGSKFNFFFGVSFGTASKETRRLNFHILNNGKNWSSNFLDTGTQPHTSLTASIAGNVGWIGRHLAKIFWRDGFLTLQVFDFDIYGKPREAFARSIAISEAPRELHVHCYGGEFGGTVSFGTIRS